MFDDLVQIELPAKHTEHKLVAQRSVGRLESRFFCVEKNRREGAGFDLLEDIESREARR